MKKLLIVVLLIPVLLCAKRPLYMDESHRFETIPLDSKSLEEMWFKMKELLGDSFYLCVKRDDFKTGLKYLQKDLMGQDEINSLIQFRNIDDYMRIGPMSINTSAGGYQIETMGNFHYRRKDYLISLVSTKNFRGR